MTSTFFFFNDTATTEIYTLSLHDALPISDSTAMIRPVIAFTSTSVVPLRPLRWILKSHISRPRSRRSEEHTSELQSRLHLVCRLLLEKKKKYKRDPSSCQKGSISVGGHGI